MAKYVFLFLIVLFYLVPLFLGFTINIEVKVVKKNGTNLKTDLNDLSEQYQILLNTNTSKDIISLISDRTPLPTSSKSIQTSKTKASTTISNFKNSSTSTKTLMSITNFDNKKSRTLPKIIEMATIKNVTSVKETSKKVISLSTTLQTSSKSTTASTSTTEYEYLNENEYQTDLMNEDNEISDNPFGGFSTQSEYFQVNEIIFTKI